MTNEKTQKRQVGARTRYVQIDTLGIVTGTVIKTHVCMMR